MNTRQLEIEEDSLLDKFSGLQSNELLQERLILQYLAKRKIDEMSIIPNKDQSD